MTRFDLSQPTRRPRAEPIIPMINVVFLLLIFFLLSASITPQEALPVDPPDAKVEALADVTGPLIIAADGRLAYGEAQDDQVWPLLAARDPFLNLPIRADASLPAAELTAILAQVAAVTDAGVSLVVEQGGAGR